MGEVSYLWFWICLLEGLCSLRPDKHVRSREQPHGVWVVAGCPVGWPIRAAAEPGTGFPSPNFGLLRYPPLRFGVSSGSCASAAQFPSCHWLHLALFLASVATSFPVIFCSDCCHFLLTDALTSSTVLTCLMCVYKVISTSSSSSFSFLPLFCSGQPFIRYC